ncbi:MAG: family 10 glycosylhydrolase [Armatimonadetes bacterium]|nr:family 10 glycosylhydrolase [Armatimonadota bacterium]MBX3109909.1 family 10 glycosylhydrolase [Fimbriimonadaceae bacterium]
MIPMLLGLIPMQNSAPPEIKREFRAAWVATVDNIDYPSKPGLPVEQMKAEMLAILDKCKELNMNAIVFQVRPHADALYKSSYEPWSYYLTGKQGKAPDGGFDPLAFTVSEAHKRGIEVHAWFNPYRANHPAQKGPISPDQISNARPDLVVDYGNLKWMIPTAKDVQDRSYNVFMEVATKYDVDGVHIDDYFYPYPVEKDGAKVPFPDDQLYKNYLQSGGQLSLGDWRRKGVDDFILRVHEGLKKQTPWVKFGISPFGIYRPGQPEGIKAGIDQYDELYADALKWYQQGWCDYYTPQLYWPIAQTAQAFPTLLSWWVANNRAKIHLWPGQFTSRTDPKGGNWKASEVTDQINLVRKSQGADGTVHFSMKAIQSNWNGVADALATAYREPALVPESPWMKSPNPGAPDVILDKKSPPSLHFSAPNQKGVSLFVLQDSNGAVVTTGEPGAVQLANAPGQTVFLRIMDRTGKLGPFKAVDGYRLSAKATGPKTSNRG